MASGAGRQLGRGRRAAAEQWFRQLSLRFEAPATERAYVESRSPQLARNVTYSFALMLFLQLFAVWKHLTSQRSRYNDELGFEVYVARSTLLAVSCILPFSAMVLAATGVLERCLSYRVREWLVVGLSVAVLLSSSCQSWYYFAKICGYEDPAVVLPFASGCYTDSRVLLTIDGIVTLAHLSLPVRWDVLLLLDAAAALTYTVLAFGLGSPEEGRQLANWLILLGLIVGSAASGRMMERHERNFFLSSLREKTLRAELEFKLSRQSAREAEPLGQMDEVASRATGRPASESTGRVFSEAGADDLHRIAALGRKEHWLLPDDALEVAPQQILGHGAFGIVVAARLHGSPAAAKVSGDVSMARFAQLANELRVLRQLRNPHIVQFHGVCIDLDRGDMVLVEELVDGPSLGAFLLGEGDDPGSAPGDAHRHCLVLGVCCGLRYLHGHEPPIVHGDLKPDNILVELLGARPRAKLLDFGLSRLITGAPKPLGGTLRWMAPEVIAEHSAHAWPAPPHPAADVFSFGRLLYFIATGIRPLHGHERGEIVAAAVRLKRLPLHWPPDSSAFATFCAPVARRCLSQCPSARPGIRAVHEEFSRAPACGEADPPCGEDAQEHSYAEHVPWRAGLQLVREALAHPRGRTPETATRRSTRGSPQREAVETGSGQPAISDLRLTPAITKQRTVLDCLFRWNFRVRSTHCCSLHAGLDDVVDVCKSLQERPCYTLQLPRCQCPNCNVLYDDGGEGSSEFSCSACSLSVHGRDALSI